MISNLRIFIAASSIDAVYDLNDSLRLNNQAGFLENLAFYAIKQRFTQLKQASGKRPMSFHRLGSPLDQQNLAAIVDNDRANADQWVRRKLPLRQASSPTSFWLLTGRKLVRVLER